MTGEEELKETMFEHFSEEAKRAVIYAGFEAARLGSYVGTEHLLLGLVRENPANIARFTASEISVDSIRDQIATLSPTSEAVFTKAESPLSDESKDALSEAEKEADLLGHRHIGPEHLLLGILCRQNSLGARILGEHGVNIEQVRQGVMSATEQISIEHEENRLLQELIQKELEKNSMMNEGHSEAEFAPVKSAEAVWPVFPNLEETFGWKGMPKHYTVEARRSIFFARYEAWQAGSPVVEAEHLLMGVLREDKAHLSLFLPDRASLEAIRTQIESGRAIYRKKISIRASFPFSDECNHVEAYAEEEAHLLGSKTIGPEHLLLGLLREEGNSAARILREHGAELESIRKGLVA